MRKLVIVDASDIEKFNIKHNNTPIVGPPPTPALVEIIEIIDSVIIKIISLKFIGKISLCMHIWSIHEKLSKQSWLFVHF